MREKNWLGSKDSNPPVAFALSAVTTSAARSLSDLMGFCPLLS